jgi:hypothetical protein
MQIKDLLKRDLSQKIEEIIQLDQADEHAVYTEITEYVATDSIIRQYRDLLEAINLSRTQPTRRCWATARPISSRRGWTTQA